MFGKRLGTYGVILLGILAAGGLHLMHKGELACLIGGAISGSGMVWDWIALRCPACRRHLPIRGLPTAYCPHCGQELP